MLEKLSTKLLSQLSDGLEDIAEKKLSGEKRLSATLQLVRALLNQLNEQEKLHPFKDRKEEIHFFKNVKPCFLSAKIFELERYNLEQNKPVGTWETLLSFYEKELEVIQRFFTRNAYLYQYYRSGLVELDELYFVRGAEIPSVIVPEFGEPNPEFSTAGDYLFAKFKAYEQLRDYILEYIRISSPASSATAFNGYQSKPLLWTGESINLVELGYGLFDSGQLNNGKAGVNDIFKWLEEHFNVSIGIPARRFVEIKRRKRLSRTRFLDNMRESVNKKVEEDELYDPEKINAKNEIRKNR
jgi:hypothetical protein